MVWKRIFNKIEKTLEPKTYRILVTHNMLDYTGQSEIKLIGLYFPKYGLQYKVVDKEEDFIEKFWHYTIEISYSDKDYVETLLNRVLRPCKNYMLLNQYERWLKTERIRRKILNI